MADLSHLEAALGHQFADPQLLAMALTHRSVGKRNYERLEFLGDGLLNFVAGRLLFQHYAEVPEGHLSRLRSALVRRETLADIARALDLGSYIRLGPGELASGGYRRDSILSDCVESLIAACYLDADFDTAEALVERLLAIPMGELDVEAALKDPKTRLQEMRQADGRSLPVYTVVDESGPAHNRRFRVTCGFDDVDMTTTGEATSRRHAEQQAARAMLSAIDAND